MYKENNWFVLENYLSQHYVFGGPIYAPDILGDHFHEETIDWVERLCASWAYCLDSTSLVPKVLSLCRFYFLPRFLISFMPFLNSFGWTFWIPRSHFALDLRWESVRSWIFLGSIELKAFFLHASSRACRSNSPISTSLISSSICISIPKDRCDILHWSIDGMVGFMLPFGFFPWEELHGWV